MTYQTWDETSFIEAPEGYYWFKDTAENHPWHVVHIERKDPIFVSICISDIDQIVAYLDEDNPDMGAFDLRGPIDTPE